MTDPVCLDTNVIMHFLNRSSQIHENQLNHQHAVALIEKLRLENRPMILPVPALFEVLVAFTNQNDRYEMYRLLRQIFIFAPFDSESAFIAAELFSGKLDLFRSPEKLPRDHVKIDWQIIACAIAKRCSLLFTCDKRLHQFSSDRLQISPMPES